VNQLVSALAGAPQAGAQAGTYYQNAINQATGLGSGSLGKTIVSEQNAALQPQFKTQDQQPGASLAAQGITNSGAAKASYGDLASKQSGVIAGADAPVFQTAEGIAGNILGQQPGAQQTAYSNAVQQFLSALQTAATGIPGNFSNNPPPTDPGTFALPPGGDASNTNMYIGGQNPYGVNPSGDSIPNPYALPAAP
jgi:hypothetical protein